MGHQFGVVACGLEVERFHSVPEVAGEQPLHVVQPTAMRHPLHSVKHLRRRDGGGHDLGRWKGVEPRQDAGIRTLTVTSESTFVSRTITGRAAPGGARLSAPAAQGLPRRGLRSLHGSECPGRRAIPVR